MKRIVKAPDNPARLVILISGGGSNLQAVLDACVLGLLPAEVVAVFSNVPDAYGLERARQAGVPAVSFPKPKGIDRREYDAMLVAEVEKCRPDWILLLGWMRVLSSTFLSRFPGRIFFIIFGYAFGKLQSFSQIHIHFPVSGNNFFSHIFYYFLLLDFRF